MNKKAQTKIQLLPEHIIDQIKAGEVIERPSTLLKEIIENSIDAGSTKIDLKLLNNGLDLISLEDNGSGINSDDLPLAFCRHATSKIERFEDIYGLYSYGFRGEALASIASISKITCLTHYKNENAEIVEGNIKIEGARTISHQTEVVDSTTQTGTHLYITDLFFNTPARMKFIQSKNSEKNQLKKIINAFMLTQPEIAFSIKWDLFDKEFYQAFSKKKLVQRIKDVLFRNKVIDFVETESFYDGCNFQIFFSKQSTRGNAHKSHYLFVNDRFVSDFQIHKIILNSAKNFWPEGETGHYVAYLSIPSDEIDVNVHPNKTVVKLFKAPAIYSLISSTIKAKVNESPIPREPVSKNDHQEPLQELPFETSPSSFKDIDYKKVDFNEENALDNYFQNLHTSSPQNSFNSLVETNDERLKILLDFDHLKLIQYQQKNYIIHKDRILFFCIKLLLKKKNSHETMIPLLVSQPLSVKKSISTHKIDFLLSLGFEIDALDSKTLVLRSFPTNLQNLPYRPVLELLLHALTNVKDEMIEKETFLDHLEMKGAYTKVFDDFELTPFILTELLNLSTITNLIENKILKSITQNDLAKIYDEK